MPEAAEFEKTIATGQALLPGPLVRSIAGSLQATIAPRENEERQERTQTAMERLARVTTLDVDIHADASELRPSSLFRLAAPTDDTTSDAQYVMGKLLGRGGMGEVREAVQTSLGRPVAVKTLRPRNQDPSTAATLYDTGTRRDALKLVHESWVTGLLEHPNILPIHDIALDDRGRPLIVLKRIEGQTWDQLMADADAVERQFGAKDLGEWNLRIFMQVCNAIHFAHSRHIIHRDIKPENVMIGAFGEVYVLDWGIALSLGPDYGGRIERVRDNRELAGTPIYMAPEMFPGLTPHPLSLKTDVYLLGATLYKVLTGTAPHTGETAREVLAQARISNPVFPATVANEIAEICRRALASHPHERYESAEHLRVAVQDFLQFRGSLQVCEAAQQKIVHMHSLVAKVATDGPEAIRSELYSTHAACRFGFQTALQARPHHRHAEAGLREVNLVVAHYEAHHGDLRAALALLEHID
ncbi:MAG: serine/threonine-protein kinase, partial [Nannocystaceae bacterium]